MKPLRIIERDLDAFFGIEDSGVDPAFSRFLPEVYDGDERPWRVWFEPGFVARFNGLMIRGEIGYERFFSQLFRANPSFIPSSISRNQGIYCSCTIP